ncbi:hypothetical protein TRVL_08729 [Trypanosoma vivax]|nr:hypothetical protein TRVL_08729 [Trypanosoma vivax]
MLTRVRDWATCRQHCVQSRSPCLHVLRCSNHQPITCARKRVWHRNKAKRKIVRKRCSPDGKRRKREHTAMQSGRVVGEMPHKKKTKKKRQVITGVMPFCRENTNLNTSDWEHHQHPVRDDNNNSKSASLHGALVPLTTAPHGHRFRICCRSVAPAQDSVEGKEKKKKVVQEMHQL